MAQRQKSTALSSFEAEVIAASEAGKEAAWMEKVTLDLGERTTGNTLATSPHSSNLIPTLYMPTLYCDNQGAVDFMKDAKFHNRSKHIEIRYMYVRNDLVQKNRLKVVHIAGKEQMADILTKQLPALEFRKHCRSMGLDVR